MYISKSSNGGKTWTQIVRVDSQGGDGIASDDILHEMKLLSKKKPVLISMSDLAASGGYFIAMTGDPVLAYSNTLTGSIGVFFGKVTHEVNNALPDLNLREKAALSPIAVAALVMGVAPLVWLSAIDPAVQAALAPFSQLASKGMGQ